MVLGEIYFVIDDGLFGVYGNVGCLLLEVLVKGWIFDVVYVCGVNGMLKVIDFLFLIYLYVYFFLEEWMVCGIGVCYVCVCYKKGDIIGVKSVKVCDEGLIFKVSEVIL